MPATRKKPHIEESLSEPVPTESTITTVVVDSPSTLITGTEVVTIDGMNIGVEQEEDEKESEGLPFKTEIVHVSPEGVTYELLENSNLSGKPKIFSSDGHSYGLIKKSLENDPQGGSIWKCTKRTTEKNCPARIVRLKNGTYSVRGKHLHPPNRYDFIMTQLRMLVKKDAIMFPYESAMILTRNVMEKYIPDGIEGCDIPIEENLASAARRYRYFHGSKDDESGIPITEISESRRVSKRVRKVRKRSSSPESENEFNIMSPVVRVADIHKKQYKNDENSDTETTQNIEASSSKKEAKLSLNPGSSFFGPTPNKTQKMRRNSKRGKMKKTPKRKTPDFENSDEDFSQMDDMDNEIHDETPAVSQNSASMNTDDYVPIYVPRAVFERMFKEGTQKPGLFPANFANNDASDRNQLSNGNGYSASLSDPDEMFFRSLTLEVKELPKLLKSSIKLEILSLVNTAIQNASNNADESIA